MTPLYPLATYSPCDGSRRDRLAPWTFAVVVAAWMVAEALTGHQSGLLYAAPALVLALPLLLGRLVASGMAKRPPPAVAPACSAI